MEPIETLNTTQPAQPLPDISTWTNEFTQWGIWTDIAGTDDAALNSPREPGLGLLLAEARVATARIFAWTAVLLVLGLAFGFGTYANRSGWQLFGLGGFLALLCLSFLGAALYRVGIWFLNRNLVVRVFREGFSIDGNGPRQLIHWRDISTVRENWRKIVIQAIIHINIYKLTIHLSNGEKVELDRTLAGIERVSQLIQAAVAAQGLPAAVERLKNDKTCEFGSFKISRYGISQGKDKLLPWKEAKSLVIGKVGQTTLTIYRLKGGGWATVNGNSVPNLQLFTILVSWFIAAAKQPAPLASPVSDNSAAAAQEPFDGDVHYILRISQKEARLGLEKKLYIGPANREQRLVVKIPAGVASKTVYPFPGYGRPPSHGGADGTLYVAILVEKAPNWLEAAQVTTGAALLAVGMIWLAFWSSLDLISSTVLAALIGAVAGTIMAIGHRRIGATSGVIGAVISFFLQIIYYRFMYLQFGRDSFSDYEIVFLFIASIVPGIGLYLLLTKKRK